MDWLMEILLNAIRRNILLETGPKRLGTGTYGAHFITSRNIQFDSLIKFAWMDIINKRHCDCQTLFEVKIVKKMQRNRIEVIAGKLNNFKIPIRVSISLTVWNVRCRDVAERPKYWEVVKGSDKNLHQMFFFALPFPVQVTHPTLSQILIYFLYPVAHAAITISVTRLLLWLVVLSLQKVDQLFVLRFSHVSYY
jgi:hypothetical protein